MTSNEVKMSYVLHPGFGPVNAAIINQALYSPTSQCRKVDSNEHSYIIVMEQILFQLYFTSRLLNFPQQQ